MQTFLKDKNTAKIYQYANLSTNAFGFNGLGVTSKDWIAVF